jgi:DNA repair protein RecN (Recombination protein N)
MLNELKVSNFAIIDTINVQFKPGFNVLSGETGSGKSVLLKSLALLMGEKSVSEAIKTGATQATVEGLFDISDRSDIKERLHDSGLVEDDSLIVKRLISADGKNRVYINGSLASLHQLREVVSPLIEVSSQAIPLIEMTGQHENRHLQSRSYHLEALDQYIGTLPLRKEVNELFAERNDIQTQLSELEKSSREKSQRLDFLTYQRDEIQGLGLKPGDEDDLINDIKIRKDLARLNEFIAMAESALYSDDESALVRLHRTIQKGSEFASIDGQIAQRLENLQQAKTLIEEFVYELRDFGQKMNADGSQLELLEEKLSVLRKLQKKYGPTVREILEALQSIQSEISNLESSETIIENLQKRLELVNATLDKKSKDLHKKRVGGAATLAKSVNSELEDLNMKGLLFGVQVTFVELSSTGYSQVEFTVQTSKKDEPRPLAKFASGGELSRILLSLKRVVGHSEHPRTYLFDEVDAGVSGVTAEKVGRKLKSIAKGQQVICVTHLPQVAAFADAHYVISKVSQSSGGVHMKVIELNRKDQVQEIARMLSGEKITKASLEHAR